MIKDRGMMKWQGMMLTEHVAMLKEYNHELKKNSKPQLDEWDYDAIQHTLDMAIKSKADTKVKLWRDGQFFYKRGTIESIDLTRRTFELDDPFNLLKFNLDEIVDVTIMD
ncbi:YolD-like family protein [Psychrobacillus sp. INOP01]|uniref:YolD-like family protein n=1 Tax=Psychrobacillus sp. INOP01 TaxID=2829187 RepID=UPI001BADCA55|nr:YolD-like family protein [Psychrobacillus sp. INOP01]QUG41297.1 YolD-like family protein [Psychrobacillus sp. INOP01]